MPIPVDKSASPLDALATLEAFPKNAGRLALTFGPDVSQTIRRRIEYAFRVFCAVYGYRFANEFTDEVDARISYAAGASSQMDLVQSIGYTPRELNECASTPVMIRVGTGILPCFHLPASREPDWLGEIFEWISAADEQAITERDGAGRIPYEFTLHGRYSLDPAIPYAAVAMRGLNDALRDVMGGGWRATPAKLWTGRPDCVVAATHDVDFLPLDIATTLWRLFKNIGIAAVSRDWPRTGALASASMIGALRGTLPLNAIRSVRAMEQNIGIGSTYNILCRQEHRRDANYSIDDQRTQAELRSLSGDGFELGLHGSYTSLDAAGRLTEEYDRLRQIGHQVAGGRQHWLRYRDNTLFDELSAAGACYDCSVGYSAHLGFRTGACFPYPPYDFKKEQAYPLLELPMAVMDTALYAASGRNVQRAEQQTRDVLATVRQFGWGGVSVLWHDTVFDGGQYPQWLGKIYWQWKEETDAGLSCIDLVRAVWPRFEAAGLLPALDDVLGKNGPDRRFTESKTSRARKAA